ncbi:glycosyltransferase family 2 protein [Fructilactobacillus hinvesii]|uniref:Glycosyltransferase family 2 protein n=1 Tax=Fructilactobacillus hinvesii TaxID=2940300 RepID=A0ABY5BUC4_9LACO|nr:glycosyltransferase family 2 protein [Fructilactobacillus hinvesii]USS88037.1 glycosyltransferase family 2 protein [Fructilactobacillus hinvesii]
MTDFNYNPNVAVVLVTFNRLQYLKESLNYLLAQQYLPAKIYVINNASTDGTTDYLATLDNDLIEVVNLDQNVGGAGGFSAGLKIACEANQFDYYWVMDDDTYPKQDSLQELIAALQKVNQPEQVGVLASNVRWGKDSVPAIMNIPQVNEQWNQYAEQGLVGITSSSFVSMLISDAAVRQCGLPVAEFFIWGDDVEYSRRITQRFDGYFVGSSLVEHATKANTGVDIIAEQNPDKIGRYYYNFRNQAYIAREFGKRDRVKNGLKYFYLLFKITFGKSQYKLKKVRVLTKGYWKGLFFKPTIQFPQFKKHN